MGSKFLTEQQRIPFLGALRQLFGGASTWITIVTLGFSGLAAWNTSTMGIVRNYFPWLSLGIFMIIVILAIIVAMWLEHKVFQASIMNYWSKMFWDEDKARDLVTKIDSQGKQIEAQNKTIEQMAITQKTLVEWITKNNRD